MSAVTKSSRITPQKLLAKKHSGEPIVSLTAYDYTTATLMDQTNVVDFILVGDSLGMVVLGYPDTLSVTLDDMIHHTKAVSRGVQKSLVVTDMPFMSVHSDLSSSVKNVGRVIQEGRAQAVKIEGATPFTIDLIKHLTSMGISVMGHLGFTPQFIQTLGGYKVQGKQLESVKELLEQAQALEEAGAFAIVLEMVPSEVAAVLSRQLTVPTIGIGAGTACDGQILVIDDLLARYPNFKPKFARTYAQIGLQTQEAITQYATDVIARTFPDEATETFHFPLEHMEALHQVEQTWEATKEAALCTL